MMEFGIPPQSSLQVKFEIPFSICLVMTTVLHRIVRAMIEDSSSTRLLGRLERLVSLACGVCAVTWVLWGEWNSRVFGGVEKITGSLFVFMFSHGI